MKKVLSIILVIAMLSLSVVAFASCGNSDKPIIGILQFGSHGSLDNCREGIINGLKEKDISEDNYKIEVLNNNFDMPTAQAQAQKLVNEGAKIIIGIATPSAIAAAEAAVSKDIPVVFCAVTDGTTLSNYQNITGSSDVPNFAKQLEVVTSFMNKRDVKIGVLYSTQEDSSPYQLSELKKAAQAYDGMVIVDRAVQDITTIDTSIDALISDGVECFVNLLDNTIVGKLESNILVKTNAAGIPVFGSEVEQVKVGCAASASIDYLEVGRLAGVAAAEILGGKAAKDIPVKIISDPTNYYNSEVCTRLGLTVPTTIQVTDVKAQ